MVVKLTDKDTYFRLEDDVSLNKLSRLVREAGGVGPIKSKGLRRIWYVDFTLERDHILRILYHKQQHRSGIYVERKRIVV